MESPDDTSFSSSNLLCDEDDTSLLKDDGDQHTGFDSINPGSILENEEQYIENLFKREMEFASESRLLFTGRTWLKSARLDAIDWIFNTRARFGFKLHTAYLSVTYLDRFLSKRSVDEREPWSVQILSVGCLSLAAKMEEQTTPALSQYSLEDYHFDKKVIKDMELLILSALEWKMGSVTPFAYLHYFVKKFCRESRAEVIVPRAVEHIVATVKDINLIDYRPSIIASAAILAAFDGTLSRKTMDFQISVISSWGALENDRVFSCYKLMQEKDGRKTNTPASILLSTYSSFAVTENSSLTSSGSKRKLIFGDSEDCP